MDFEDMERKIRDNRIHAAVFCSPHNPCGRVWTKEELEQAFAIFAKYDVKVVSDEIWSDLILSGHRHIPVQSVSDYARENTVALYAPSKTFNLAGFVGSYHIIYNKTLRERVLKEASLSHYNDMNVLSMYALIGAYSAEGEAWLEELRRVLTGNTRYAVDYIRSRFEGVTLAEPEGTYMLFPDCTGWCGAHKKTLQELEHLCWQTGVALQDGKMFNGQCHLRINLALPLTRVREAMERLDRYVFNAQERFDMVGKSVHFGCEISR
jgi:cystathionine beta-lyase